MQTGKSVCRPINFTQELPGFCLQPKIFISDSVLALKCHQCSNEIKACDRQLSWPQLSKGDVLSAETLIN